MIMSFFIISCPLSRIYYRLVLHIVTCTVFTIHVPIHVPIHILPVLPFIVRMSPICGIHWI